MTGFYFESTTILHLWLLLCVSSYILVRVGGEGLSGRVTQKAYRDKSNVVFLGVCSQLKLEENIYIKKPWKYNLAQKSGLVTICPMLGEIM